MDLKVESVTTFAEDIFDGVERLVKRAKMEHRPFRITDGTVYWNDKAFLDALYETGIEEEDDTEYALKDDDLTLYEVRRNGEHCKFYPVYWIYWED